MNVILTVPGSPGAPGVHLEDKFAFPVESLGLGYLAAMLQAHDIEVQIVDGYADRLTWQETVARILQSAADDSVVGISVLQSTAPAARLTAQALRQAGCDGPIMLGGWLGSAAPLELMSYIPEADYLLLGEAEHTFLELVRCLKDNRPLDHIPGLLARRSADDYNVSPAAPAVVAMDRSSRPPPP